MTYPTIDRRRWLTGVASTAAAAMMTGVADLPRSPLGSTPEALGADKPFGFRYLVGSSMYGYFDLPAIVPEVRRAGATAIDIWPKVHGDQREELEVLGVEGFNGLARVYGVTVGCITQYKLGPFGLTDEMRFAQRLGCRTIVTGGEGPKGLQGDDLKKAVATFVEKMRPHLELAEETGVHVAIENHASNLIDSPDALKWLIELRPSTHLRVALAPYHLPQDTALLAKLIRDLGEAIEVFYAWQHGNGAMTAQPREQELLQMPGRGPLDFGPLVDALRAIDYQGWTEIFMHPYPRGRAIADTPAGVTDEILKSAAYLESFARR